MQTTGAAPAPAPSVYLGVLLREVEHSGSGSALFWQTFWASLPHLSDAELERVALACGERGRAVFRTVSAPETGAGGLDGATARRLPWSCADGGADAEVAR